ncbi:peptidoglycan DD-metalloendopeptidase family protein [Candidatus Giovannonibacteria bacterium]|nr:peptidoglycan DD-metalloendopeptidase family protein [Candidatus Giovannonibacteria bacterium]
MKKAFEKILFAFLISFMLLPQSGAKNIEELEGQIIERESQIEAIQKEIALYQKQIERREGEAKTLKNEIARLESIIKKLNADIRFTEQKISASKLALEKISIEIDEKTSDIKNRKNAIAQTLRALYQSENSNIVEILISNDELSDFFGDLERLLSLQNALRVDVSRLTELKTELESKEANETEVKVSLEKLSDELSSRKSISLNTQKSKNTLLIDTKNKEAEYQRLLRDREKKRAEILDEMKKIEDELRLAIDPSSLPQPRKGVLAWPVSRPYVTQKFGLTAFAQKNSDIYGKTGHNGIDLRAALGTPIFASEDGVVKGTGNSDNFCPNAAYGLWIMIGHNNGLASVYGHLSLIQIRAGQNVKRGDLIAYSGESGYTTGPHLHFTVYGGKTSQIRNSRFCGPMPYGGPLDPLNYL